MPSFNLYRGALLAMLVGTALAVFLIVRPPGESGDAAPVVVNNARATPTAAGSADDATVPAETPGASETAGTPPQDATPPVTATAGSGTAAAGSPTPAVTATESPFNEYTVQSGDTLYDIATANLSPGDDLDAFARAIAALNNIDFDNPVLPIGETILLPKPPQ